MPRGPKGERRSAEIELRPDGWQRFEAAISAAVKSGPQHRARMPAAKKAKKATKKPRE
jgi:hypothetical protein